MKLKKVELLESAVLSDEEMKNVVAGVSPHSYGCSAKSLFGQTKCEGSCSGTVGFGYTYWDYGQSVGGSYRVYDVRGGSCRIMESNGRGDITCACV